MANSEIESENVLFNSANEISNGFPNIFPLESYVFTINLSCSISTNPSVNPSTPCAVNLKLDGFSPAPF